MKNWHKLSCVALMSALCVSFLSAQAVTRVWKGENTGGTISNASAFEDESHWWNGVPVAGDGVYLTNCTAGVWNYIRASSAPTLSSLNAQDWQDPKNKRDVVFVSDAGLNFKVSSGNSLVMNPHVYANVASASRFTCWTLHLCGDYSSTLSAKDSMGQLTLASNDLNHRLDRYANAAGGSRANPMDISVFYHGAGTYSIFAPQGLAEPVTSSWNQTGGSPFLYPVNSGTIQVFSAGAPVSGEGVPPDTYLKRVFPDGSIELSNPIASDKTKDGNELTFGPLEVSVSQRFDSYTLGGDTGTRTICLNRRGEADQLTMTIGSVWTGNGSTAVWKVSVTDASAYLPGELVLEDTSSFASGATFALGTCHVTFAGGTGFPNSPVTLPAAGATAQVTVADGVSVQLGKRVNGLGGSLVKDGAGVLSLALTNGPSLCAGSVTVNAGAVAFIGDAVNQPYVGNLSIADGGRIVLGEGGLRVGAFTASGSVEVSGNGVLTVPASASIAGVKFTEGAKVRFGGANVQVNWTSPATNVVGCPALWVDASKVSSMTMTEGKYVSRIEDVRGAEHFYATASSSNTSMQPVYTTVGSSCYLKFSDTTDDAFEKKDPQHYGALVWNRRISGIRAVFLAQDTYDGGGEILGSTSGISDFARPSGLNWTYLVIWSEAAQCVKDATCYVNGERRNFRDSYAYPYRGGSYTGNYSALRHLPNVTEVHPTAPGASADCWGMDSATDARGHIRLCECIVYTNELTEAERLAVAGYLSRKWVGREISYETVSGAQLGALDVSNVPGIAVADGESVAAKSLDGSGELQKTGAGTLSLLTCADASAKLNVAGGKLVIGSGLDDSVIPDGAYLHLDASKPGTVTLAKDANGREYVKKWADVREESAMSAVADSTTTNGPTLKEVSALQNRNVVDFGPWSGVDYVKKSTPELNFTFGTTAQTVTSSPGLRTEIVILGSANGGGSLIGGGRNHGFNEDYGITRSGGSSANALVRDGNGVSQGTYAHANSGDDNKAVRYNDIRVNGVQVLGTQTDVLSGAYDLVTFSVYDAFGGTCFGAHHWGWFNGGNEMGEVLLFREQLTSQTLDRVEAYLRQKWFGVEPTGYPAALAESVNVSSGAELEIRGGSPIRTASISGDGTIRGDVTLVDDSTLSVEIGDGTLPTLTVTGALKGDGTVVLTGDLNALPVGRYALLRAGSVTGTWTLDVTGAGKGRICSLSVGEGVIYLDVAKSGLLILVE